VPGTDLQQYAEQRDEGHAANRNSGGNLIDSTSAIGEPVAANDRWGIHPGLVDCDRAGVA
jgi:hypothetical protein